MNAERRAQAQAVAQAEFRALVRKASEDIKLSHQIAVSQKIDARFVRDLSARISKNLAAILRLLDSDHKSLLVDCPLVRLAIDRLIVKRAGAELEQDD